METTLIYWGHIRVILRLYWDTFQEALLQVAADFTASRQRSAESNRFGNFFKSSAAPGISRRIQPSPTYR